MAGMIAIEGDGHELRIAAASLRGGQMTVEHAAVVKLATDQSDDTAYSEALAKHLTAHGLQKTDAVIVLGRAGLELRLLTVPPVPPEDLPDVVRYQAIQQFSSMGDDWPLDYSPTDTAPEGVRQVLAAAVSSSALQQVLDVCEAASVEPRGVILRACGTATLVRHQVALNNDDYVLAIELLNESVDLTVLNRDTLHLARTVRLPHANDEAARRHALLNEIRRTLASARTTLKGKPISRVLLLQEDAFHIALKNDIESMGRLPAEMIDPLHGFHRANSLKDDAPQDMERLAPLLGVLLDELHQRKHAIDFLRPKRRPAPPNRKQFWMTVGTLTAVFALFMSGAVWWTLRSRDKQILALQKQSAQLDKQVAQAEQQIRLVETYQQWLDDGPNWLIEMNQLSRQLPPSNQVMLYDFTAGIQSGTHGTITIKGSADDSQTVGLLEDVLRSDRYDVVGQGVLLAGVPPRYPWTFEERITLNDLPESEEAAQDREPIAAPPATAPAADKAEVPAAANGTNEDEEAEVQDREVRS